MKINSFIMVWAIMACCFVSIGCDDDLKTDDTNQYSIDKARSLDDNMFVIERDSDKLTYSISDESEWSYKDYDSISKISIIIKLPEQDFDPKNDGGYLDIPVDKIGELTIINELLIKENPYPLFRLFFCANNVEVTADEPMIDHNLKLDGTSMFLIQKIDDEDNCSEQYRLLFNYVFINRYDGLEYTVYGNVVANKHIPKLNYFSLKPESDFVKVGESVVVNLEDIWEEGAPWDWNDVEIVAQYDYENSYLYIDGNGVEADMGFFSWDAASHTLTSLKSNDNKSVFVRFALKSNPSSRFGFLICTGEGWGSSHLQLNQLNRV